MTPNLKIQELDESSLSGALRVLSDQFGPQFNATWFRWKHRSNPWGPSLGWVAVEGREVVGVRLMLRWRLTSSGGPVDALRPCDTVTAPQARGKGVFSALVRHALDEGGQHGELVFNTPNSQSMPGYLKIGFRRWATVGQRLVLILRRATTLSDSPSPPMPVEALKTDMSAQFIDWRYRSNPVFSYGVWGIAGDEPNGIVTRSRRSRGLSTMVVSELWGGDAARRELVRAAASQTGTSLVWINERDRDVVGGISLRSSSTEVTRYDLKPSRRSSPHFSVGDVENVI